MSRLIKKMDHVEPQHLSSLLRVTHNFDGTIAGPSNGDMNFMHWNIKHLTYKLNQVELRIASFPGVLHLVFDRKVIRSDNSN